MVDGIYDELFEDALSNGGTYDLTEAGGTDDIYIDLLDSSYTPNFASHLNRSSTASADISDTTDPGPKACANTFTLSKDGDGTGGDITWRATDVVAASFSSVDGTLTYVATYYANSPAVDADYKLVTLHDSGAGIGSTLVAADVDVKFAQASDYIFHLTS